MANRYAGEIRINPVAILRNDDFNNDGRIGHIGEVLAQTLTLNSAISDRITRLQAHLSSRPFPGAGFRFAEGGYISMSGFSDKELLEMKSKGLIDLFDNAGDKEWVKKHGAEFGLVWENGKAVKFSG